jgi:23S rRNA pseudouridine1911/1915/1917 synthase
MKILETHKVPLLEKPIRLQEYAVGIFTTISTKSALKKVIKKGLIQVNNEISTTARFIHGGEIISLCDDEKTKAKKELELKLEVLFEDDYLAIVYKPAGILVSGNKFMTIDNALEQNLEKSKQNDAVRPRPVHRLDYPTSGLLLIGKTASSIMELNKLFENKEIQKTYYAVAIGKMKPSGSIDLPIDEKISLSHFETLKTSVSERFEALNFVKLSPKTGRRHQLRKHFSEIGNPILGDLEYGKENLILKGKGLYLHAASLEFMHPFTKEKMKVDSELPKKFEKLFPSK